MFLEHLEAEKLQAEGRFRKLEALYNSLLEPGSDRRAFPKEYLAYLKRERDLAYALFLLKTKECAELEQIITMKGRIDEWLQPKN